MRTIMMMFVLTSMLVSPAAAKEKATTWCWAPDVNAPRTCVYTRQQCQDIVRLRRSGVCTPSQRF